MKINHPKKLIEVALPLDAMNIAAAREKPFASTTRAMAYRLNTLCERKDRAAEARPYNGLAVAWRNIEQTMSKTGVENMQLTFDIVLLPRMKQGQPKSCPCSPYKTHQLLNTEC